MWIEKKENSKGIRYKYTERFLLPDGKNHVRVSVTLNSSTRHAQKQAAAMLQAKFQNKYIMKTESAANRKNSITFYQVAAEWLEYMQPIIKASTMATYNVQIERIKRDVAADLPLVDFSPAMAENIIRNLYYTAKGSFNYTISILATIKSVMKYAKKAGYIKDVSEYIHVRIKRRPATSEELQKASNKFLDRDELKDCLHQLQAINERVALAMEFIALTGLRIGELLALRLQDYDKQKACISVNGTIQINIYVGGVVQRGTPKNSHSYRTVFLNDRARQIIDHFILDNKKAALWNRGTYKDRGYIFTDKRGCPYNANAINAILKKIYVPDKNITTHMFRHTHISILTSLGLPIKTIMQRVGHSNPNTTLKIYTHVTQSMQDELKKKIQAFKL